MCEKFGNSAIRQFDNEKSDIEYHRCLLKIYIKKEILRSIALRSE